MPIIYLGQKQRPSWRWCKGLSVVGLLGCFAGDGLAQSPAANAAKTAGENQHQPQRNPTMNADQASLSKAQIRTIKKDLKESEQALITHRDLANFLYVYAPSFAYIYGRSEVDRAHDYRLKRAVFIRRLKQSWKVPSGRTADVFFQKMQVEIVGQNVVVRARVRFILFGLQRSEGRIYTLTKLGKHWKVKQVRVWPLNDDLGGQLNNYTAEFWKNADQELVDNAEKRTTVFLQYLTLLLRAHRFSEAYTYAKAMTEAQPNHAEAWKARGALAHQLGQTEEAERCAKKARTLNPTIDIPAIIR
ncbi:MAG: tetratricopeptide repeat protein [Myxococcota bacterium]|nr:tetratricopeptide repeat protein [Myxococcota bacterium]